MTKPLSSQLSQQDAPAPRSGSRPRAWLVALLGFGAADLLVLNLWAVPNMITPADTTTDMRAAQSGEARAPSAPEPQPSAAVEGMRQAPPGELAPSPQPTAAETDKPRELEQEAAQADARAPAAEAEKPSEPAGEADRAEARAPAEAPTNALAAARANLEPDPAAHKPELARGAQVGVRRQGATDAPAAQAEASADAYVPSDPNTVTAFAIRAAQRAMHFALADRAAGGGDGPFDGLTDNDLPFTQIYFSLGNFQLGPNGKQVLERILPQLTSDQRPILIVGSADPTGSEQINEKLSDARAQSVAEWLLVHGVDAGRIQTRAIGHEGAAGTTLDRRVDIWLGGSR